MPPSPASTLSQMVTARPAVYTGVDRTARSEASAFARSASRRSHAGGRGCHASLDRSTRFRLRADVPRLRSLFRIRRGHDTRPRRRRRATDSVFVRSGVRDSAKSSCAVEHHAPTPAVAIRHERPILRFDRSADRSRGAHGGGTTVAGNIRRPLLCPILALSTSVPSPEEIDHGDSIEVVRQRCAP